MLIGAKGCAASLRSELPRHFAAIRHAAASRAGRSGHQFVSVGVAVDHSIEEGVEFLKRFPDLDQMAVGGAWMNESVVRFIWRDIAGEPVLPQVLLLRRSVDVSRERVTFGEDSLLSRAVGTYEIGLLAARLAEQRQ